MIIEVEQTKTVKLDVKYIGVDARVRYWEDTTVNGIEDKEGDLIPFRNGDLWQPCIDIEKGVIVDWPIGTTARVHYNVGDNGEYYLLNDDMTAIAKYKDYYVPNGLLCHGDYVCGDYIIMHIDENGKIEKYVIPEIEPDEWEVM